MISYIKFFFLLPCTLNLFTPSSQASFPKRQPSDPIDIPHKPQKNFPLTVSTSGEWPEVWQHKPNIKARLTQDKAQEKLEKLFLQEMKKEE